MAAKRKGGWSFSRWYQKQPGGQQYDVRPLRRTVYDRVKLERKFRTWLRYREFAEDLGWDMLAICAYSASFRKLVEECSSDVFFEYRRLILLYRTSLRLVADFERPSWRRNFQKALPGHPKLLGEQTVRKYTENRYCYAVDLTDDGAPDGTRVYPPYEYLENNIVLPAQQGSRPGYGFINDPELDVNDSSMDAETVCAMCSDVSLRTQPVPAEETQPVAKGGQPQKKMPRRCYCSFESFFPARVEVVWVGTNNGGNIVGYGIRALQVGNPARELLIAQLY